MYETLPLSEVKAQLYAPAKPIEKLTIKDEHISSSTETSQKDIDSGDNYQYVEKPTRILNARNALVVLGLIIPATVAYSSFYRISYMPKPIEEVDPTRTHIIIPDGPELPRSNRR